MKLLSTIMESEASIETEEVSRRCERCNQSFTFEVTIHRGYSDRESVECPLCGISIGEVRCDIGLPKLIDKTLMAEQSALMQYGNLKYEDGVRLFPRAFPLLWNSAKITY